MQAIASPPRGPFGIRPAALHGATAVLLFLAAGILLGSYLTVRTFRAPRGPPAATAQISAASAEIAQLR